MEDDNFYGGSIVIDTSFASALQQGQSFFQRARIVSISTRHGFPPSKDPTGEKTRVLEYLGTTNNKPSSSRNSKNNTMVQTSKILAATQKRPIDGILPSGWLEKHAAALPSVILVVLQINHGIDAQWQQDDLLQETLQNLTYSLAPKRLRYVSIQVVGLMQEGVSQIAAEQWAQGMSERLSKWKDSINENEKESNSANAPTNNQQDSPHTEIILLPIEELQPDYPYNGSALQQLHNSVRNASLQYYSNQTRRVKEKLLALGAAGRIPVLLPLMIRYYFKVAMFYEFQWKQEKSLKYMVEAYRLLETYYRYLLQQREISQGDHASEANDPLPAISASNFNANEESNEGVELSLKRSDALTDEQSLIMLHNSDPAEDMVYQCRSVADWINFKILQSGLVSNTEGGLLASSAQWQRHSQAFCCPRRSFIATTGSAWLEWSYVARQYIVISQLLERYPARSLGSLDQTNSEESLLRFSSWRTYEAASEALLKLGFEVATGDAGDFKGEG